MRLASRTGFKKETDPLAGSHIFLIILFKTSFPPSLSALMMLFDPCSLTAYSRRPLIRWSRVCERCFGDPCSRTGGNGFEHRHDEKRKRLTMLHTVAPPLVLRYLAEHVGTLIKQFVYNPILGAIFEVFKSVLNDKRTGFMTSERGPFAFERLVDAVEEISLSVMMREMTGTDKAKMGGAGGVHESSIIYSIIRFSNYIGRKNRQYLAPNMTSMFVDQRLRRITP